MPVQPGVLGAPPNGRLPKVIWAMAAVGTYSNGVAVTLPTAPLAGEVLLCAQRANSNANANISQTGVSWSLIYNNIGTGSSNVCTQLLIGIVGPGATDQMTITSAAGSFNYHVSSFRNLIGLRDVWTGVNGVGTLPTIVPTRGLPAIAFALAGVASGSFGIIQEGGWRYLSTFSQTLSVAYRALTPRDRLGVSATMTAVTNPNRSLSILV